MPFYSAVKFPFFIYKGTILKKIKGSVSLSDRALSFGKVKIGVQILGTKGEKKTVWEVSGNVSFCGKVDIGSGTEISVSKCGVLQFGDNFVVTGCSHFLCSKKITFGDNCLFSWDILIMDSDQHKILDKDSQKVINENKEICIKNNVWLCSRVVVLKGVSIENGCVISCNSLVAKNICVTDCVVYSNGAEHKVLRNNIYWCS